MTHSRFRARLAILAVIVLLFAVFLIWRMNIEGGPRLELTQTEWDLGRVQHDSRTRIRVPFRNSGDSPLVISRVVSGCSCIATEADKPSYEPGESGYVDVEVHAGGLPGGKILQGIYLYTNETKRPYHSVTLTGTMAASLRVTPNPLNLGEVLVGSSPEGELLVIAVGETTPFHVTSLSTDIAGAIVRSEPASMHIRNIAHSTVGSIYRITIKCPRLTQLGALQGVVTIKTDSHLKDTLEVSVLAQVISSFQSTPVSLLFRRPAAAPQRLEVVCDQDVEIQVQPDQFVQCDPLTQAPSKTWRFDCQYRGGATSLCRGKITLEIQGHPTESVLEIPYTIIPQ